MTRQIWSISLLVFISLPLWSQVDRAGFLNSTEGTIYFIALPVDEEEYRPLIESPESFKALIAEHFSRLEPVPSGGLHQRLPIYQQDTLVTGYMQRAGRLEHPLFSIIIQGGEGNAYYELGNDDFLYATNGEVLSFSIIEDELPTLDNHLVDGRIIDWLHVPDSLNFDPDFIPLRTRQGGDTETRKISLEAAQFWGRGGTFLDSMRTDWEEDRLHWMVSTFDEISEGLSIFLYFYEERNEISPNVYTIEVPIVEESGPVLLWQNTRDPVKLVGSYHRGEFFVEFLVEKEHLPDEMQQALEGGGRGSFDLSSGFSDGQTFEDFLFITIPARTLSEY